MATVEEIFAAMPGQFDAAKAGDFGTTIQFDLAGDDGGQWYVVVDQGSAVVTEGLHEEPAATIRMSASDFVDMMTGDLDPMNAFMMGKVRVEGDLNSVMKFQTLFG
ncbi:MAG: SCP2 sterol-binding domain-containing protein [Anaerolineae bacterium]|nr:SCP2 sterol-binding domain-containing protein [Anaerolineae bacterium]